MKPLQCPTGRLSGTLLRLRLHLPHCGLRPPAEFAGQGCCGPRDPFWNSGHSRVFQREEIRRSQAPPRSSLGSAGLHAQLPREGHQKGPPRASSRPRGPRGAVFSIESRLLVGGERTEPPIHPERLRKRSRLGVNRRPPLAKSPKRLPTLNHGDKHRHDSKHRNKINQANQRVIRNLV